MSADAVALLPYEHMALAVARSMVERGVTPGINTVTVLVMALDRLTEQVPS